MQRKCALRVSLNSKAMMYIIGTKVSIIIYM